MHPTAAKLQERLRERGLAVEVRELPDSTRTAAGTPYAVFEIGTDDLIRALPDAAVRAV
jgi:hypothetical protein